MKIPDERPEPLRDIISPEIRMNEYMKNQKYALGESVTEPSDYLTSEPSTSLKRVTFSDSIAETSELHLPSVNGRANGVAFVVTKAEDVTENDSNHVHQVSTSEGEHSKIISVTIEWVSLNQHASLGHSELC